MTDVITHMNARPEFTLEAIRARSDLNDHYRREHRLPYSDADIRQLLMYCEEALAEISRLKGSLHAYGKIRMIFHDHIRDMAARYERWNDTDAHDRVRAVVLYRVGFHKGWPKEDVEDYVRDEFYAQVNENRERIGELTREGVR